MKGEIDGIARNMAGIQAEREPSRLAARGSLQSVGNARSLSATRMLRPGQRTGSSGAQLTNCKL